ncbi:MAG TPA: hydroxymethylglutaryl-CoA reductase, degradative [Candidatus Limosilactobacillus merdipullorum]|uniref:3-hydroxy-3-methylglutaryl coenzyme A reductase n=1 Tax=Candidatus Limosilactobacillus merdipullorum TaxID=2838653 RepID=A0A9D1QNQ4_9LACO|nr:hydroxymethylglutaryl-CoA reductase, degradative [Candidatus Limosilactobacillus merdipullorum]
MTNNQEKKFYEKTPAERRAILGKKFGLSADELKAMAADARPEGAQMVENYLTDYRLPEGVVTGLVVNGKEYTVPMAIEEPSVIAAACNGARMTAYAGGVTAEKADRLMIGQVVMENIANPYLYRNHLLKQKDEILKIANDAYPSIQQYGGGAVGIRVRCPEDFVVLDLLVNVVDAMGANTVNTMAEAVGRWLSSKGQTVVAAILSNYATDSLQSVSVALEFPDVATDQMKGADVAARIADLSFLAQVDSYRAATHNKGIMNGIDAVLIAAGNDWRAVESGAQAYAAMEGQYRGLATWHVVGDKLIGKMTLPMAVGTVGGSIGARQLTATNAKISQIKSVPELAAVAASVGLVQNLAALRALASTGIQEGHMKLQYRVVAMRVGATAEEAGPLADRLAHLDHVDEDVSKEELSKLRKEQGHD